MNNNDDDGKTSEMNITVNETDPVTKPVLQICF